MDKSKMLQGLRDIANILQPFTRISSESAKVWNGKEYKQKDSSESFEPFALAWWFCLNTIADLLESQESEISIRQKKHLQKILFGGMGSFSDFYLDEKDLGEKAKITNKKLQKERQALYKYISL